MSLLRLLVYLLSKLVIIMRTQKFSFNNTPVAGSLFPDFPRSVFYVYVLTDCNRTQFRTGVCSDLGQFLNLIVQARMLAPTCGEPAVDKLVYLQANVPVKKAEKRVNEIMTYTRMQKDRLIRMNNPDWKDLRPALAKILQEAPSAQAFTANSKSILAA